MVTQQYISDKSIADCVEALIGAHLIYLGPGPTQKFMGWLGLKVLQEKPKELCDPLLRFVDSKEEVRFFAHFFFNLQYYFSSPTNLNFWFLISTKNLTLKLSRKVSVISSQIRQFNSHQIKNPFNLPLNFRLTLFKRLLTPHIIKIESLAAIK